MNNRIRELRTEEDLTQAKLAELVDIRRETIVFLKNGKYNPSSKLTYTKGKIFNENNRRILHF